MFGGLPSTLLWALNLSKGSPPNKNFLKKRVRSLLCGLRVSSKFYERVVKKNIIDKNEFIWDLVLA